MTLMRMHRVLIWSGIVVCLLLAVRLGWGAEPSQPFNTLVRIGCPLLAAAMQGYYLYRIRRKR